MAVQTLYGDKQGVFLEKASLFRFFNEALVYCFAPFGRSAPLTQIWTGEETFWTGH
jgi:hypothetical protein